jgi:hypothetical protein
MQIGFFSVDINVAPPHISEGLERCSLGLQANKLSASQPVHKLVPPFFLSLPTLRPLRSPSLNMFDMWNNNS